MVYWLLMLITTFILDFFAILGHTSRYKNLEIIILRQQVRILQPKVKTPPRISDPERMILAILVDKYSQSTKDTRQRLHQVMLIFKSDPVLRWHRELVRRKWTFSRNAKPGRPTISSELEALILRLAKENPRWGYDKIQGELLKLGYSLSASSVRNFPRAISDHTCIRAIVRILAQVPGTLQGTDPGLRFLYGGDDLA